jgi:hypothetical protein
MCTLTGLNIIYATMGWFWNSDLSGILKQVMLFTIPMMWVGVRITGAGKRVGSPKRTNAPQKIVMSNGTAFGGMILIDGLLIISQPVKRL